MMVRPGGQLVGLQLRTFGCLGVLMISGSKPCVSAVLPAVHIRCSPNLRPNKYERFRSAGVSAPHQGRYKVDPRSRQPFNVVVVILHAQ